MCSIWRRLRRCVADEAGQTTSEYLVLSAALASIAVVTLNIVGIQLRQEIKQAARLVLRIVTGDP